MGLHQEAARRTMERATVRVAQRAALQTRAEGGLEQLACILERARAAEIPGEQPDERAPASAPASLRCAGTSPWELRKT